MTRIFGTTAIALVIGAFALPAAAQQNQAAKGETMQNACWQQLSRFDDDKDGSIGPKELAANKRDIFAALNRDNDDEISRDEYMRCFSAQGGQNRMQQTFTDLDRDRNQRISEAEFTEGDRLERTQVMVEQRRPQVTVQQSQPTVTVDQKRPTVQVDQSQPQPTVRVEQAQPKVSVTQPQPKVSVQQAEPKVRVEQAQPRVMVEQAKPKVEVDQADPKVKVEQADPKVKVDRQAGADVNRINPDRERGTPVERAQNVGDSGQPMVGVAVVDVERTWADGQPIEMNRMRAEAILGRDIVNLRGNEVGDIEDIVIARGGNDLFAVISVGGFLGIGDKDVVVPFSELRMGDDNMILMSQKSEDGLRDMPAYDENQYQRS